LTCSLVGSKVQKSSPTWESHQPVSMEEIMSSTASLITLLASVAFGLIVLAVIVRLGPRTPS